GHHLHAGEQLAATIGDRLRTGRMAAFQAHLAWARGEPRPAIAFAERALAIGEAQRDLALTTISAFFLGQACHLYGDYERSVAVLTGIVECLIGDLAAERFGMALPASVVARVWLAFSLAELGKLTAGRACANEAVRTSDALGKRPYSDFHTQWAVGVI